MVSDPYTPGWRPHYRSDHALGDVGAGPGFGADLHQLYKAGRALLPEVAAAYAALTRRVHQVEPVMRQVFEVDGHVEPANQCILALRAELQEILRRSSIHIEETGHALVQIADRYAATDEAAAREMARLTEYHEEEYYRDPPPAIPERPKPGDPPLRPEDAGAGHHRWE